MSEINFIKFKKCSYYIDNVIFTFTATSFNNEQKLCEKETKNTQLTIKLVPNYLNTAFYYFLKIVIILREYLVQMCSIF